MNLTAPSAPSKCTRCGSLSWWRDQDGHAVCMLCARPLQPQMNKRLQDLHDRYSGFNSLPGRKPTHMGARL